MKKEVTQQPLDSVLRDSKDSGSDFNAGAVPFDFTRLDRISKSQLRAIHLIHETFVRNLSSSLSVYLRSYITFSLISLQQISYAEFVEGRSSPTCIAYIGLSPYDDVAVIELNPSLALSLVEILLGGRGETTSNIQRKITEIERHLLQNLMRIIMEDLTEAWKSVAEISFEVQSVTSEPRLFDVLAPTEAVAVIDIEVRLGAHTSLMSLAIPSIFLKRLRHKFEQMRQVRRAESTASDQVLIAGLIQDVRVVVEARLDASTISANTLLTVNPGDVLELDHPLNRQVKVHLNGTAKYVGEIKSVRNKLTCAITAPCKE